MAKKYEFLRYFVTASLFMMSITCFPQTQNKTSAKSTASVYSIWPSWPKARADDVKSVQSIISTYFEVLSGKSTDERDWERFRSLFLPDGRMVTVKTWNRDPHLIPAVFDVERLVDLFKVNARKGDFTERSVKIEQMSSSSLTLAFVTSDVHIQAGKNDIRANHHYSFELAKDADRYWIVEVVDDMTDSSKASIE